MKRMSVGYVCLGVLAALVVPRAADAQPRPWGPVGGFVMASASGGDPGFEVGGAVNLKKGYSVQGSAASYEDVEAEFEMPEMQLEQPEGLFRVASRSRHQREVPSDLTFFTLRVRKGWHFKKDWARRLGDEPIGGAPIRDPDGSERDETSNGDGGGKTQDSKGDDESERAEGAAQGEPDAYYLGYVFVGAGAGYYDFDEAESGELGYNLEAGIGRTIKQWGGNQLVLEASLQYHEVSSGGVEADFVNVVAGLRYYFGARK